jgi:hypothetical protein
MTQQSSINNRPNHPVPCGTGGFLLYVVTL